MRLQLFNYKCAICHKAFQAPSLYGDFLYGQFLMRNPHTGNLKFLNALEDPEYDKVRLFIKNHPRTTSLDEEELASRVQMIFGLCCDRDVDGNAFEIDGMPSCPYCDGAEIEYWEATEPPEYRNVDVSPVTHHNWDNMGKKEKEMFLTVELTKISK